MPRDADPPRPRTLLRHESGAIMVIAVFMAVFMAAMLLYLLGLGDAVLYRERMQDAADAAALSSAVTHARGMNLIVLINLVMAAMLSVLVALRLIQMLATLAIAIAMAASILAPAAAGLIPPLKVVRAGAGTAYGELKMPIMNLLKMLNLTARAVRAVVPTAAQAGVIDSVVGHYRPPAKFGFTIPSRFTLPVENDSFDVLCDKSGEFVGEVVMYPLHPIIPKIARDAVGDALGSLAGAASAWFCGKPGAPADPPTLTREVKDVYPRLGKRQECNRVAEDMTVTDESAHAVCDEARVEDERSEPDHLGRCRQHCSLTGPYAERARAAREQCDPRSGRPLMEYHWVEQKMEVTFERTDTGWTETDRRPASAQRLVKKDEDDDTHPCGDEDALYERGYNDTPFDSSDTDARDRPNPVCAEPADLPEGGEVGDRETVETTEVLHILRCSAKRKVKIGNTEQFSGNERPKGGADQSPQRVEDVALGSNTFQLRAVVIGKDASRSARAIDMALWGHRAGSMLAEVGDFVDWLAVAQAEYYYDHDGTADRAEWMWSQRWRARLRRFRLPERGRSGGRPGGTGSPPRAVSSQGAGTRPSTPAQACAARPGASRDRCSKTGGALSTVGGLVIH